jgi:hypothetical protein
MKVIKDVKDITTDKVRDMPGNEQVNLYRALQELAKTKPAEITDVQNAITIMEQVNTSLKASYQKNRPLLPVYSRVWRVYLRKRVLKKNFSKSLVVATQD